MKKICLLGAPLETTNMGVSALAISFVKIIRYIDRNMDISFLVGAKKSFYKQIDLGDSFYNVKIVNFRMSPKAPLQENLLWIFFLAILYYIVPVNKFRKKIVEVNAWIREIEESILVGSIHGGDSFSDIYGIRRYFGGIIGDLVAILLKKRLLLLPQTYGPYKHIVVKKTARYVISKAWVVLCRDKNGPDIVKKLVGNTNSNQKIIFCPDVAFFLHSNQTSNIIFPNDNTESKRPLVGINVNGLMYKGGYNRKNMFGLSLDYGKLIIDIIEGLLLKSNANIILIPHNNAQRDNVESDLDACENIARNIKENQDNRVRIMEQRDSPSEIKGIISRCDFFIGSRMHACIAALSSGIPAVGIAYSKKFIGVFESIGANELVLDARSLDSETALNLVCEHFNKRDYWKHSLSLRVNELNKILIDCIEDIINDIKKVNF